MALSMKILDSEVVLDVCEVLKQLKQQTQLHCLVLVEQCVTLRMTFMIIFTFSFTLNSSLSYLNLVSPHWTSVGISFLVGLPVDMHLTEIAALKTSARPSFPRPRASLRTWSLPHWLSEIIWKNQWSSGLWLSEELAALSTPLHRLCSGKGFSLEQHSGSVSTCFHAFLSCV